MNKKLKIDIVSDVVCPWCVIGYKRLEQAIKEMGVEDSVEINWQPFELNPNMPPEGEKLDEHIARKYGSTPQQIKRNNENISKLAAEVGVTFNFFDEMIMPNTRDAHILIDYAKEFGKETELNFRLVESFFTEKKDISKREILEHELKAVGLHTEVAITRLDDMKFRERIIEQEVSWQSLGISSVPTMIFNESGTLNGAQPVDVYKKVLSQFIV